MMARSITMYLTILIWSYLSLFSVHVAAEIATATDETGELIVAREILQGNTAQTGLSTNSTTEATVPQVANDMAEGQFQRDLPTLNKPVIDQAKILNASEMSALSQQIYKLHDEGKAQIGVVIVPTTGQEDIFSFAMRVAEQWQLGSAKRDQGLLIAIAINDRRIQILTGYGLEGVLPDIIASRIIRDQITPYFKQAQYGQGIQAGLNEIERILTLDPEVAAQAAEELRERQAQAYASEKARSKTFSAVLTIVLLGAIASLFIGNKLSAGTAAVASVVTGLVNGMSLVTSLLIGLGVFLLIITTIAQLVLHVLGSGLGRGGGSGGSGGFGGGGFSGGGGGFGGGGASGSW